MQDSSLKLTKSATDRIIAIHWFYQKPHHLQVVVSHVIVALAAVEEEGIQENQQLYYEI